MRFRSPYSGQFVSAAGHRREVHAAAERAAKWEAEVARRGARLERVQRPATVAAARVALAEALRRQYRALEDAARLAEQEKGKPRRSAVAEAVRELAEEYEQYEVPFTDEELLYEESEGQEFEIRADSEGETGEEE